MTPAGQLPQWVDMGEDQDYASSTGSLVDLLKKRMKQRPQGGMGTMMGNELGGEMAAGKAMSPEGAKSL